MRLDSQHPGPLLRRPGATLTVEQLEARCMPAIRLDLVALHEFGHSLGLAHSNDPSSIMYPYYNANYDLNNFANDSAVATFRSLYANPDSSPWKDNLDGADDGVVNISYSFMPDGVKMDSGKKNTLNATLDRLFGAGNWEPIFADMLNRWASVSNGHVTFTEHGDGPYNFAASGQAQNDPNFGDIRIGAHRFDGAGKTLAHTYYPPPNGGTAAGDAHFDQSESWSLSSGGLTGSTGGAGGGGGGGSLTLGPAPELLALPVDLVPIPGTGTSTPISSDEGTATPALTAPVNPVPVDGLRTMGTSATLPITGHSTGEAIALDSFAILGGLALADELGR